MAQVPAEATQESHGVDGMSIDITRSYDAASHKVYIVRISGPNPKKLKR
ncbi:MAG: hypothetical protein ACOYD0_06530 [Candidatus Nanopelagicales bacterium]